MELDFIVHPEWVILSKDNVSKRKFSEEISNKIKENGFLVQNPKVPIPKINLDYAVLRDISFAKKVSKGEKFLSNQYSDYSGYYSFGHVSKESFEKLKALRLNKKDKIRIHGCFIGNACVTNLAYQLFGLIYLSKNWYDWSNLTQSKVNKADIREGLMEIFPIMSLSNIKYGIVYSNDFVGKNEFHPIIPEFLRWKKIDEQMIDENTKIYGAKYTSKIIKTH